MALTYIKIASVNVGAGGASSIDFTNIPSTYTDLVIKFSGLSTSGYDFTTLKFNGSSANYTYKMLRGSGTAAGSFDQSIWGTNYIPAGYTNVSPTPTNVEIYIPNYANSSINKSVSVDYVSEANTTVAYSFILAGLWSNTAAITSISLSIPSINLAQYSSATLYGVLKA